ncbi:NDP-sugar pyrophosphorylase family protein [Actinoalloteichus hoggarensis]|uniref:D-glycero-alpha-D-manno-heptose 1-phosphate guanylyltransferase n=1 Tax=Actinoalloteichus hoggarensis TaxID=1470176 RepID=A0A221W9N5_9PSEU|nr:nucleotidyltransferase family protein [Actinoalloteichus hoggarensis]ASO22545.1 D-glycero-alpha-D-manno-heptose 1-phosphate guanylyltransferase [Actinoalloteichus hoggarensis]MBB5923031.1 NDP-sugar pyrophosphorylase family protein [Actinoalloteichus hoggarensis]
MTQATTVRQAVILAGGQGTRLRPHTDTRPKPMIEISGRCIIDHQLDWLAEAGVEDVVVSAGYLAEVLIEHLESTAHLRSIKVRTVVEDEPLGRGGGLRYAGARLPDPTAPWYALNGDIWTRFSLAELTRRHVEQEAVATVALARPRLPWGVVDLDESGRINDFVEAPLSPYPINGGVYVFSGEILAELPEKGDHERTTFPQLAARGKLAGHEITGYWRAIDTAKDIREAAVELAAAGRDGGSTDAGHSVDTVSTGATPAATRPVVAEPPAAG